MRPRDGSMPALLLRAIRDPAALRGLDAVTWQRLLSCARRNAVLAYLAERAHACGMLDSFEERPRLALMSARIGGRRLTQLARWELDQVTRVLSAKGIPVIALKGIAYVLREMPHASTRLMTDIDVMVPHACIAEAESALRDAGWRDTKLDPYDVTYYRRFSHEIPPLRYPGRLLGVDVHHTICAPVSRLRPDPNAFWAAAQPTVMPGVRALSPPDSFLHAAVHLFFDSDFDGRFRDLVDLHEMAITFKKGQATRPDSRKPRVIDFLICCQLRFHNLFWMRRFPSGIDSVTAGHRIALSLEQRRCRC